MKSQHGTLVGSTVTTVTFVEDPGTIEVTNVDGAAAIYFRVDGTDPTVAGADTYVLPAAVGRMEIEASSVVLTVKLISSGTPKYAVTADSLRIL